jgi:hypothetical protein
MQGAPVQSMIAGVESNTPDTDQANRIFNTAGPGSGMGYDVSLL